MTQTEPPAELIAIGAAAAVIIFAIAALAFSRYLAFMETVQLHRQGGDPSVYLQARERWQHRWGKLHGLRIMVVGFVLLLWSLVSRRPFGDLGSDLVLVFGLLLLLLGAVTTLAYVRWGGEEDQPEATPAQQEARERRRLRLGAITGLVLMLVAILMPVYPVFWAVQMVERTRLSYGDAFNRMMEQHLFALTLYFSGAGLLFAVGLFVALGYWFAAWRFRRRLRRRQAAAPQESRP